MRPIHKFTAALVVSLVVCGAGLLLALFPLASHMRDLIDVFRTYVCFGSTELELFTYPPLEQDAGIARHSPNLVPKKLHQIILEEGRNSSFAKYISAHESCTSLHSDWEHLLWTDGNATAFVMTHYPEVVSHYMHYAQTIQRTNILRYLLLHHYGGVYLDIDITCRVPLDTLLHLPFVTPGAHPAGINNAFILARPQHPFLGETIARIPSRDISWPMPYVENMLTTGCMFITNAWMTYMRDNNALQWQDKVFVLADEHRDLESHMLRGETTTPLFKHGGASSWHSWDAKLLVFIGAHGKKMLIAFGLLVPVLVILVAVNTLRWRLGRPQHRRLSGKNQEVPWEEKIHSN